MERYSILWRMPENLYTQDSPVIVRAGVLLKDNETGRILIQLKFENISDNTIKAIRLTFRTFDVEKQEIQSDINEQYLDLSVNYKDIFGQNKPFIMSDKDIRSFEITKLKVIFDNYTWENTEPLKTVYNDNEYLLLISDKNKFGAFINETNFNEFWKIHSEEKTLIIKNIDTIKQYSSANKELANEKLREYQKMLTCPRNADSDFTNEEKTVFANIDNTLELLKDAKAEKTKEKKKKRRNKVLITLGIILLLIVLLIVGGIFMVFNIGYNFSVADLNNENYESAITGFEFLGSYKDCEEKLLEAKFGLAKKMEEISITEAYNQYCKLPEGYDGVKEKIEYLEQYLVYTEKYIKISVTETDGNGNLINEETLFDKDAGITLNLCIIDDKLCYAPDALTKYNNETGTITYDYCEPEESDNDEYEYYFKYNNGYGNNDYVYLSEDSLKIINEDLGLRGAEYDKITTTIYEK